MIDIKFKEFPKISRFNREVIVTEKIDGTNAQVLVSDDGNDLIAGSRSRWITIDADNFGFARWAAENKAELLKLGPGAHFGEWWGAGVQRRYGLQEKRFSLFNVTRWEHDRPSCCGVVPVLWRGRFKDLDVDAILGDLKVNGSRAAPGFMQPEGIVIYHVASGTPFKMTLDKNDAEKGQP